MKNRLNTAPKRILIGILSLIITGVAQANWTEVESALNRIEPTKTGDLIPQGGATRKIMLLGNGDMGVMAASRSTMIEYFICAGEFPGPIGKLEIKRTSGGGNSSSHTAFHHQNMSHGEVIINAKVSNTRLDTVSYVPHLEQNHENMLVIEMTNKDSAAVTLEFMLKHAESAGLASQTGGATANGTSGNIAWVSRELANKDTSQLASGDLVWRAGLAMKVLSGGSGVSAATTGSDSKITMTLGANQSATIVLFLNAESGFHGFMPSLTEMKDLAVNRANNRSSLGTVKTDHQNWWKNYWQKSYIVVNEPAVEKYYYGLLYYLGNQMRKGHAPPALQTIWFASDQLAFGGAYVFNYNYIVGFYGCPSANRIDQFYSYYEALFQGYHRWRYNTNTRAKFPGLAIHRYNYSCRGGNYFDPASWVEACTKDTDSWALAIDYSDNYRNYSEINEQKSLTAYLASPIIKAYLNTEDMALLDYENTELYGEPGRTGKGVSVYKILRDMAEFYTSYFTTECKDNASGNEWQPGDGEDYTYRVYDSWAREPESNEPGVKADVKPRNGTGDVDTSLDLGLVRYFFRGMIKIAQDRGDTTAPVAAWQDILDHLVDYPTTANDGLTANDNITSTYGAVFKECKNRPELNYNSQGRDTLVGTMATWLYPGDEGTESGAEAAMFKQTLKAMHDTAVRTGNDMIPPANAPQFLKDIWGVFNDYNNLPQLFPMMVRSFYDGQNLIDFLEWQQGQLYTLHNGMQLYPYNLAQSNGPESCAVIDGINDMLLMGHLSETAGAGSIGKSGKGADDHAENRYMKLFPCWPTSKDAKFHQIRTEGAFLVSAELSNSEVTYCEILSEKGNVCRIKNPWEGVSSMTVETISGQTVATAKNGEIYSFKTTAGQTYVVKKGTGSSEIIAKLNASSIRGEAPLTVNFDAIGSFGPITSYELDVDGDNNLDFAGSAADMVDVYYTFNTPGTYVAKLTIKGLGVSDQQDTVSITVTAPADNLRLQYKMNETSGTSIADSAANNLTGALQGSATVNQSGKFGKAVRFTASGSGVLEITNTDLDLSSTDGFTLAAWVNPTSLTGANTWVGILGANGSGPAMGFKSGEFYFRGMGSDYRSYKTDVPVNQWSHLAITFNHTSKDIEFFYNGTSIRKNNWPGANPVSDPVRYVGRQGNTWGYFDGLIDDVRVYDKALTTAEIQTVMATESVPQAPTGVLLATPTSGPTPLTVSFDASNSTDDGTIQSYEWDFDSSGGVPDATGVTTSHSYTQAGTYSARLTLTDDMGEKTTVSRVITVGTSGTGTDPVAVIQATPTSGSAPLTISFDGSSSSDSDGNVIGYAWDFDNDGITDSTSAITSHTYNSAGTYTAKLTVTDNDSRTDTAITSITVNPAAAASNIVLEHWDMNDAAGTQLQQLSNKGTLGSTFSWSNEDLTDGNGYLILAGNVGNDWKSIPDYATPPAASGQYTYEINFGAWSFGLSDPKSYVKSKLYDVNGGTVAEIQFLMEGTAASIVMNCDDANYRTYTIGTNTGTSASAKLLIDYDAQSVEYFTNGVSAAVFSGLSIGPIKNINLSRESDWTTVGRSIAIDDIKLTKLNAGGTNNFSTFVATYNLNGAATADHDGDGVVDFAEYALDLDPTTNDKTLAGSYAIQANNDVVYTFKKPIAAVTYKVQYASDLTTGTWQDYTGTETDNGTTLSVTLPANLGSGGSLYIRLRLAE